MSAADDRRNSIIKKVESLLAKAESTEFEAEAEALYAKAQELMLRHAIDEAVLGKAGGGEEPVIEKYVFSRDDNFRPAKLELLFSLGAANRVRAILDRQSSKKKDPWVWLAGTPSDIRFVKLLYVSVYSQAAAAASSAWRAAPKDKDGLIPSRHRFWSQFLMGYAVRVRKRLEEVRRAQEQAVEGEGKGHEVVLASAMRDIDELISACFNNLRDVSVSTKGGAMEARNAGNRAGANADLSGGRNNVGGTRRALGAGS